jgi:hypothetical protein
MRMLRGRMEFSMAPILPAVVARAYSAVRWGVVLVIPLSAACGAFAAKPTACDGLVYKEGGLTRSEYLPCAGEMMATLDRLAQEIEKMLAGDESARSDASAGVSELRSLLKKAGWRDMVERWDDGALTNLNVDIWNAFSHHEACLMVAGQLFGRAPLGDEKNRERARAECSVYRRSYEEASRAYRRLR